MTFAETLTAVFESPSAQIAEGHIAALVDVIDDSTVPLIREIIRDQAHS